MFMKKSMLLVVLLLSAAGIFAQGGWNLDKSHTHITFSVPHMVVSEVTGNFSDFDIKVTALKEDFSDLKATATIKTASVFTDNAKRDEHLKSDDFFNAEKYPEIKFTTTEVKKGAGKNFKITGNLTIRDITKKVTFDAVYNGTVKTPWGQTMASFKASAAINRFDYNLKWSKALESGGLVAGDKVTITMTVELVK
jgi:polyisoprenoid-binding protein YceI